jgi:type IV pilus assembly protein PilY1
LWLVGFAVYQTSYVPGDWTGDLIGEVATVNSTNGGVNPVTGTTPWSARAQLDTLTTSVNTGSQPGWDAGRRVITFNGQGVPFRWSNLSAAQQGYLNSDKTLLNYIRGDSSNEGMSFRIRRHTLGDIVSSQAVLVQGALSSGFSNAANPGYSAFATSVQSRAPVIYVGANDGMMHAFAGDFSTPTASNPVTGGGSELFAYVPSFVLPGPNATPAINGLAAGANLNGVSTNTFTHHFYVDQTPQVGDVDFDRTCSSPDIACPSGSTPDWHSILVGALGKGGKGIYALDITKVPGALDLSSSSGSSGSDASENAISQKALWEFTDKDMGYSFGRPLIGKTRKYGWVVLMTSGYDNTGAGYLYVLNAKTGKLLEKISDSSGSAANPSGLGRATAYSRDVTDGTVDQVYVGDLQGDVWRFDLTSPKEDFPSPTLLATLTDASGIAQPITTAPRIELDTAGLEVRRWVFVGTGRFLDTSDLATTQRQSMYALRDGTDTSAQNSGLPLSRKSSSSNPLMANADLLKGVTLPDTSAGWYYDLIGASASGATERIVVDPDAVAGISVVTWVSLVPGNDPCGFEGEQYAVNFGGQTMIDVGGSPVSSLGYGSALTTSKIVQLPTSTGQAGGQLQLLYGQSSRLVGTVSINSPPPTNPIKRVNWREILN